MACHHALVRSAASSRRHLITLTLLLRKGNNRPKSPNIRQLWWRPPPRSRSDRQHAFSIGFYNIKWPSPLQNARNCAIFNHCSPGGPLGLLWLLFCWRCFDRRPEYWFLLAACHKKQKQHCQPGVHHKWRIYTNRLECQLEGGGRY